MSVAREGDRVAAAECPFVPGFAGLPPYLAGREPQQTELEQQLDQLSRGRAPNAPSILHGPRGNGKTTLLNWTRQQAVNRGINVLELRTSEIRSAEDFVNHFSSRSWWRAIIESISIRGAEVRSQELGATNLSEALAKLVKKQPAILLIDEAHTLEPALGTPLFQATLSLMSEGKPFQLVLAGTPDLRGHMGTMGVTFWERSLVLPISRLDQRGASDAIRIPLEMGERPIAADALERVVQESDRYPYFLQLWGQLLWEVAGEAASPLTTEDVNSVHPEFVDTRDQFYLSRYSELKDRGLLAPAVVLAEAFEGRDSVDASVVDDALKRGLGAESGTSEPVDFAEVRDKLHDLGYIWSPGAGSAKEYYSGIPSLMSFVAKPTPRSCSVSPK